MNSDMNQNDIQFLELIVKQLVQFPDNVQIDRSIDERGVLLTLRVDRADMGKVIGKSGQTAKALRVLLRVFGSKNNARINLKIVEPDGTEVGGSSNNDLLDMEI